MSESLLSRSNEYPIPEARAFEEWWRVQEKPLEMSPAVKFAAWNGWLERSKRVASESKQIADLRAALGWFVDHPDECPGDHPEVLAAACAALDRGAQHG